MSEKTVAPSEQPYFFWDYDIQVELDLLPGWYDITLRFLDADDHSHVYLYWQLPEGTCELIPTRYLCPPKGTWQ
jgi:hypothetical protein